MGDAPERTSAEDDPHAVLGVPRDADVPSIRRAFRRVARECHPDVAGGDPDAAARFRRARDAWQALIDPVRRAALARPAVDAAIRPAARRGRTDEERGTLFEAMVRRARAGGVDDVFRDFGDGPASEAAPGPVDVAEAASVDDVDPLGPTGAPRARLRR